MPLTLQELRIQGYRNPEEPSQRPSRTPSKATKTQQKIWRRVRRLSEILSINVGEARKAYKNITETQKRGLDVLEIPARRFQSPQQAQTIHKEAIRTIKKTTRRPSKGDPNRPVRAGAPNEYIQNIPEPTLVTLSSLKKLKEICLNHFGGNWELLAEYATTLGNILKDLK